MPKPKAPRETRTAPTKQPRSARYELAALALVAEDFASASRADSTLDT